MRRVLPIAAMAVSAVAVFASPASAACAATASDTVPVMVEKVEIATMSTPVTGVVRKNDGITSRVVITLPSPCYTNPTVSVVVKNKVAVVTATAIRNTERMCASRVKTTKVNVKLSEVPVRAVNAQSGKAIPVVK